jgi:choloylglycine hydrolase
VATNAPFLDWHLTNLRNYTGITASNPTTTIDGFALHPLGNGGGLRGLPGDYTPPGRFVRAVAQVSLAAEVADGPAAERSTLHILNTFDINAGLIRETGADGKPVSEVTEWSTVSNLTGLRYAYRTINDPAVYVIDLATTDFSSARSKPMPDTLTGSFVPATL